MYIRHTQSLNSGQLDIGDLVDVQNSVWEARMKWYNIGLGLLISPGTLDAIKGNERGICERCFREILKNWLNRSNPKPTWTELAGVLRSPSVGYERLAEQLSNHLS